MLLIKNFTLSYDHENCVRGIKKKNYMQKVLYISFLHSIIKIKLFGKMARIKMEMEWKCAMTFKTNVLTN